jgi:hypothetical protein
MDARIGRAHFGDALRESLEELVLLRRHDPAHRFAHCGIVDCVVQIVALAGGAEVDDEFKINLERLRSRLLLGQYAVDAELTDSRDEDAVHAATLAT